MEKGHCHNGRQDFDHALLDDDDRDKFEAGDMCIVDLTDDDGPPKWGLAKITAVKPQTPQRSSISIGLGPTPKLRASPSGLMPQRTLTAETRTVLRSMYGKRQKP